MKEQATIEALEQKIKDLESRNRQLEEIEQKNRISLDVHSISTESKAKIRGVRVLVAEDNAINLMLTQRLLEKFGYMADAVENGRKAVTALEAVAYDIVLMDVQMPEMDGYEATGIIRDLNSRVLNHKVPVIAMTANAMPEDRNLCLASGMDDYLSKPISPNDLYNMLEKYIQATINGEEKEVENDY